MSFLGSFFQNNSGVTNLDSDTFAKQIKEDNNAVILDVRTNTEYSGGHIPGSVLIDLMKPSFRNKIGKLDRSKSYYVYCRSGNRSYRAGKVMVKMGFEKVYNLENGMIGWNGEVE